MKRILAALAVGMLASLSAIADNYVVYRVNHGTCPRYVLDSSDYTASTNEKVEFLAVFRVNSSGNIITTSAPVRFPLLEASVTTGYMLYLDPSNLTTSGYYTYNATTNKYAYKFLKFGGNWSNLAVDNSSTAGKTMILRSYEATAGGAGSDRVYLAEQFSGQKEAIKFMGNTLNAAKELTGTMSFVYGAAAASPTDDVVMKSGASKMSFDMPMSMTVYSAANMTAAVAALKTYLAAKGYIATWTE